MFVSVVWPVAGYWLKYIYIMLYFLHHEIYMIKKKIAAACGRSLALCWTGDFTLYSKQNYKFNLFFSPNSKTFPTKI